uniref:Uncharacterized protein n=1 Tax=Hyaloperonospora arabidopsidis (strain Emoy2) TaxID=559515 RepID=M4BED6_HYAAE
MTKTTFLRKYNEWQKNLNVYDEAHPAMERIQAVYMISEAITKKADRKESRQEASTRMATTRTGTRKSLPKTTTRKRSTVTTQTHHRRPCLNVIGASFQPTLPTLPTPRPQVMKPPTPIKPTSTSRLRFASARAFMYSMIPARYTPPFRKMKLRYRSSTSRRRRTSEFSARSPMCLQP